MLTWNPHRSWDKSQYVYYPEPIAPKTGPRGWYDVVQGQTEEFGLLVNPQHRDATERDFKER